jgi:hypothetical protein
MLHIVMAPVARTRIIPAVRGVILGVSGRLRAM